MKFPYRPFSVQSSQAYPFTTIFRPVIPIWLEGAIRLPMFGKLDTGADDTTLPHALAAELGVTLDLTHPVPVHGIGGPAIGYYGALTFELIKRPKIYRWMASALFVRDPGRDDEPSTEILLGHTGFFRYFRADFRSANSYVEIRPSVLFSGVSMP